MVVKKKLTYDVKHRLQIKNYKKYIYVLLVIDVWQQHNIIHHSHSSRVSTYNLNVNFKNTINR